MESNAALGAIVGMLSFALIGGLFGAAAGAFVVRSGRTAGARIGRWVADSFASLSEHGLSPTTYAGLVGASDGAFFLGVIGLGVGLFAPLETTLWMVAGLTALCFVATLFGVFAYALVGGNRLVAFVCGPIIGSLVGICLTDGNAYAGLAGTALGLMLATLTRSR
jgi:hypothetical protein